MLQDQPSRTLLATAVMRAQHQLLDTPLIMRDPVVVELVPEAREPGVLSEYGGSGELIPSLLRALFAMRSRFAEDRLAEAVARGAQQYVIVGAGLDTFPCRQPDFAQNITIFAVDHPTSMAWTKRRFHERGFASPANLVHVPVDLEKRRLEDALIDNGFDPTKMTLLSLLGVTQYLDRESISRLLGVVAGLKTGSEIVFSFVLPAEDLDGIDLEIARRAAARTARMGELWRSRLRAPDTIADLQALGFGAVFHLTPALAQAHYFNDRTDQLRAPSWEQLIAAIV